MSDMASATPLPDQLRAIDPVCDAFDLAWSRGKQPRLEDHLNQVPVGLQPVLLAELLQIELEWRCRHGERPSTADYVQRFPSCAGDLPAWLDKAVHSAEAVSSARSTGLDLNATPPAPELTASEAGDAHPPLARLGEYDLLEQLGKGGMGEVYRARHRRLGKLVALKLIHRGRRGDDVAVSRFLREMRAVGDLNHPNVVEALDAGEAGGHVFLVMKLLEGGTDLARLVQQRGPLPVAEVCELGGQVAEGLAYLHGRGLVHRDLKPGNLIRLPDGTVKILDLGLARWREETGEPSDLTGTGMVLGTPDYLAPEQIGSGVGIDGRADLYALGATLFFLLTGRPPFDHRAGAYDKLKAHETEAAPDVRSLRPELPAGLAGLVARLLAKQPADRPASAGEVARLLADHVVRDTPTGSFLQPSPAARKRRGRWPEVVAGLGVAVVGVALVLSLALGRKPRDRELPKSVKPDDPRRFANPDNRLRIARLSVRLFANEKVGDRPWGVMGDDVFTAQLDDSVDLEAVLSRPAYAYLIAFNPDGSEKLCWPEEDQPPPRTDRPRYPLPRGEENYGLDEGVGLQVFAVVVSDKELPAYAVWRKKLGPSPWAKHTAVPSVVWIDDGAILESRTAKGLDRSERGKGRLAPGKSPVVRLTNWLRAGPGATAVTAVGFAVREKKE
jgi:serine/threonine protein kinase